MIVLNSLPGARQAYVAQSQKQGVQDAARAKLAELEAGRHKNRAERDRLKEEEDHAAAMCLLGEEEAFPKNPRRTNRLAKLDEQIAASAAAIQIQKGRIAAAENATVEEGCSYVGAILSLSDEVQADAVSETRALLAQLAPKFARLIAADQIRAATIGDRFPLPNGSAPPFSGVTVFRSFVKGIPLRIKPEELTEHALFTQAHSISSEIIQSIREGE